MRTRSWFVAVVCIWILPSNGSAASGALFAQRAVVNSTASQEALSSEQPAHQAASKTLEELSAATQRISVALARLEAHQEGMGGRSDGLFVPYVQAGARQVRWLEASLNGAGRLAQGASEVADPDMRLAVLRVAGTRLQASLSGTLLLAAWLDFLNLADAVLERCPFYSVEALYLDLDRVWRRIAPSLEALSSLDAGAVEDTATGLPLVMIPLNREFESSRENVRLAAQRSGQLLMAVQVLDALLVASTIRMALPRPPPPAAPLAMTLVMGSSGVMMGSRVVVSAEWVEWMRRLVQAGVLSVHAVGAAVRSHTGQVMMARGDDELPKGVRDALGAGPEVRAMRETGKAGAGMSDPPRHHVLPREHREWFAKRGFTGEMDIDQFCVRMAESDHQAIHGGGDWVKGRQWSGEWNQMLMKTLRDAETRAGRMLTRPEILDITAETMRRYDIPMKFSAWRGR